MVLGVTFNPLTLSVWAWPQNICVITTNRYSARLFKMANDNLTCSYWCIGLIKNEFTLQFLGFSFFFFTSLVITQEPMQKKTALKREPCSKNIQEICCKTNFLFFFLTGFLVLHEEMFGCWLNHMLPSMSPHTTKSDKTHKVKNSV